MDQAQDSFNETKSPVGMLTLPVELLVHIISLLSLRDRVKLRYVSKWLRHVIDETPSLWKTFLWPYYDSREECSVKEVLKVCGQHIQVLSFPNSRVPSTMVGMLQYCSNVQHVRLPFTKLGATLLRKIMHHMGCLQTLEIKLDDDSDITQLFLTVSNVKELSVRVESRQLLIKCFQVWVKIAKFTPRNVSVVAPSTIVVHDTGHLHTSAVLPTGTIANFRLYTYKCIRIPFSISPAFPYLQLQVEGSGNMTIPCVKLSDFGILGLLKDVIKMTDCQYGGETVYCVSHVNDDLLVSMLRLQRTNRRGNLSCVTDVSFAFCYLLHSGHLEQLAIACPHLRRLNLLACYQCFKSLKGLQAIASHCHNLQGLNLLGMHALTVENHMLLLETLSNIKLTHLAVGFCVFRSDAANNEKVISLCKKFCNLRALECDYCVYCSNGHRDLTNEDTVMLSHFPALQYCYLKQKLSTAVVQDVINNCKKLECVRFDCKCGKWFVTLHLNSAQNHNLQQLCIESPNTDIPDDFMTSVSAHCGLIRVVMRVRSVTIEGTTSLVRNSPKLITLYAASICDRNKRRLSYKVLQNFNDNMKEMFCNRKLFSSAGRYTVLSSSQEVCVPEDTDLWSLW